MLLDSDPGHVLQHTGPCDNVVHAAAVLFLLQREVQLQEDLEKNNDGIGVRQFCLLKACLSKYCIYVRM